MAAWVITKGGSLPAILADLADAQNTEHIVIFDPSGSHGPTLTGLPKDRAGDNWYTVYFP